MNSINRSTQGQIILYSASLFVALTATFAFAAEDLFSNIWILVVFQKGGLVMWPILFCSIVSVAVVMERLFRLREKNVIYKQFLIDVKSHSLRGDMKKALQVCKYNEVSLARIVQAGLQRGKYGVLEVERAIEAAGAHEASLLQANLRGLGVVANLAPMLGLLGTVIGMIKAFNVISESGTGDPGLVAAGISEALITTAAGLMVGIPSLAAYHYFRGKVDKYVYEMEEECLMFVEDIQHAIENIVSGDGENKSDEI